MVAFEFGRRKTKKARQLEYPNRGMKILPRESCKLSNIDALEFKWRSESGDFDGQWGWQSVKIDYLFRKIIPKLQYFETMKWGSLGGNGCHFVKFDQLCQPAQKRLPELEKEDICELYSLRLSGKERIWGYRDGAHLNLLWWDPSHEVCPFEKRTRNSN